ncbi:hypothetical protein TNCV_929681 [Trichonephila clavipes]|nr:hypothetical protein TNCV_929681 [Trichonephila clavipes]
MERNENKIDRERQRAGASAQNEWQRGTEANMRKKPKTGEGRATRGGKANQDATWAEPNTKLGETVRTTNDTDESGRKQELQKKGTRNRNKTRLVWFTVHECMRNRLKLQEEGEGESWLRGFKRVETTLSNCRQICVCYWG